MRLFTIFACIIMFASCESDISIEQPDPLDPVDQIRKISLDIGSVHYDVQSLNAGSYAYIAHGSPTDSMWVMLMRGSSLSTGDINFSLYLSWPKPFSGNFIWEDLTGKSTGFGCIIMIDSMNSNYRRVYKSVSGSTRVDCFFKYGNYTDSLFGTFSGVVKDSLGTAVEIRNGRFYFDD